MICVLPPVCPSVLSTLQLHNRRTDPSPVLWIRDGPYGLNGKVICPSSLSGLFRRTRCHWSSVSQWENALNMHRKCFSSVIGPVSANDRVCYRCTNSKLHKKQQFYNIFPFRIRCPFHTRTIPGGDCQYKDKNIVRQIKLSRRYGIHDLKRGPTYFYFMSVYTRSGIKTSD